MSTEGLIRGLYERLDTSARNIRTLALDSILNRVDLYLTQILFEKAEAEIIEETEDEKTLRQIQTLASDYLFETGEHNIRELHDAVAALTSKPMQDMLKRLIDLL